MICEMSDKLRAILKEVYTKLYAISLVKECEKLMTCWQKGNMLFRFCYTQSSKCHDEMISQGISEMSDELRVTFREEV